MTKTTVTAYVPKSTNMAWYGRGEVLSLDLSTGIVIIKMTSGDQKGHIGGFDIDKVNFHLKREKIANLIEVTEAL